MRLYHEDRGVSLCGDVDDSQALFVYRVNICPVLFQKNSQIYVSSEDCIMHACEPFVIFSVQPLPFAFWCVPLWVFEGVLVVFFEKVLQGFVVVIVGGDVEDCGILVVDDAIDAFDIGPEELSGVFLVEALDCLEQLLTHLILYQLSPKINFIPHSEP